MSEPDPYDDDADCPFSLVAVIYPGSRLDLVGKCGEKGPNQAQAASKPEKGSWVKGGLVW